MTKVHSAISQIIQIVKIRNFKYFTVSKSADSYIPSFIFKVMSCDTPWSEIFNSPILYFYKT